MATGGGDSPKGNNTNPWWNNPKDYSGEDESDTSNKQRIGDQSRVLMNHFIRGRIERDGLGDQLSEEELYEVGTPRGPPVVGEDFRSIANALQQIGDELDGDYRLQHMIDGVSAEAPSETFMAVARAIFDDGQFNWGRVVMLFYLAYKLAKKCIQNTSIIRTIIEWVVKFIKDYVAGWILSRGGWSAIQEYFGSSTGQALGVFLAGILSALYVYKYVKP